MRFCPAGLSPVTARSWVHHDTIVLGIQDTRLPYLQEGISLLEEAGYQAIVRNSGGLASRSGQRGFNGFPDFSG